MSVNVNEARDTFSSLGIYYELDVCHPPNTYIEVLTPNVAVSGKRALKEVIKMETAVFRQVTQCPKQRISKTPELWYPCAVYKIPDQ
ncbi:uncharacterized protein LOC144379080 isoform X3 [Halichoerus grypus]